MRRERSLFVLVLALAAGLRLVAAWTESLHLDDFHTLFHASQPGWAEFLASLRADNHPPLSFACVRLVRDALGESELALRIPEMVCGLGAVALTWRLAGRVTAPGGGPGLRFGAAWLVACSTLHLELSTDVRMYALLALAVAGLLDALAELLEHGTGVLLCALWTAVGLHAHYHFLHALLVLALASAVLVATTPGLRAGGLGAAAGLALGGLVALPWYLLGFREQLGHGLAPGGSTVSPLRLAEGYVHLVFLDVGLAGEAARPLFLAAAIALGSLAALGLLRLLTRGPSRRTLPVLLAAGALVLPAWSALAASLVPRAGFEWRYLAGAVVPLAVLAAAGAGPGAAAGLRRGLLVLTGVSALWLSVRHAADPGGEDYRGAIAWILERAEPGDAVVAADWQPRIFPHAIGWEYYAPRLAGERQLPPRIDHDEDFALPPGTDLSGRARVFFLGRSIPRDAPLLRVLRSAFPAESERVFGRGVWVLVFDRSG